MKWGQALWLCAWLALATASSTGQAQGGSGQNALRQDKKTSDLAYDQRVSRWHKLSNQGRPEEALALGESVVAEGGPLHDQIWMRGALATGHIDHGNFERARALIAQAVELAGSLRFRAAPDGGQPGYLKHYALFRLQRAQCLLATRLFRHEESGLSCSQSADSARRARELVHFSGRSQVAVDADLLNAVLDRAWAERQAGRIRSAQQALSSAAELVSTGGQARGAAAHFYRVSSLMAMDLGDKRQAKDWALRSVSVWDGADEGSLHTARLKGRNTLQAALVNGGEWQAAIEEFDSFDATLRGSRLAARARGNLLTRALAYAHAGRLPQLRPQLESAATQLRERLGPEHPQISLYEGLLGASVLAGKADPARRAEGLALLVRATGLLLEAQRRGDALPDHGIEGLATRFVLEQFLRTRQSDPAPPEAAESILAFQVADSLRGSKVQGAIQDAAVRNAAHAVGLGDLVRQEQDARNEARAMQDLVAGSNRDTDEPISEASIAAMRQRLAELEARRAQLQSQIGKAFPGYEALVRPRLPGMAQVIRQLALGEVFVLMLPVEDGVHLWALTWTEQSYRFARLPADVLAQAASAIRLSTELDNGPLKPFAAEAAWQVYRELLAPLEKQLAGARHLIVAGGGVLGSLPFAALLTAPPPATPGAEVPWLARRMAVSQVPSASAWLAIQRLGAGKRPDQALLAWGDPSFGGHPLVQASAASGTRQVLGTRAGGGTDPGTVPLAAAPRYADLPPLPETREELQAIAQTLNADPARDLLLGERATRASVLAASAAGLLASKRVVAFATHGLMAGDLPNLNQPALAMAATADAEDNPLAPLLKLDDVLGLKLNADWVVLSACNTAAADGRAEEALSGLARGFFFAGARSLLVTHWAVETDSAKLLTTGTFEHYAANPYAGKAESLRQAMLKVMALPKYGHPAFWAPYALVGDGAR